VSRSANPPGGQQGAPGTRQSPPADARANSPGRGGYLAQLVAQVRDSEPVLRRRQPSLFEPAPGAVQASLQAETADDSMQRAPWTSAAPVVPAAVPPALRIERLPAPHSSATAQPETGTTPRPRGEPLRVDASFSAAPPAAGSNASATRRVPHAPAADPAAHHAARATGTVPADPQAKAPVHRAPSDGQTHSRTLQPTGSLLASAAAPMAARHAANPLPQPTRPPPAPQPGLSHAPRRAAAPASASSQPASPAAPRELPPIHVTIGRVEVRAVAAPAPAERSRRAAPRTNLEQYLRERHGGGR
jgi:hypothetical protein